MFHHLPAGVRLRMIHLKCNWPLYKMPKWTHKETWSSGWENHPNKNGKHKVLFLLNLTTVMQYLKMTTKALTQSNKCGRSNSYEWQIINITGLHQIRIDATFAVIQMTYPRYKASTSFHTSLKWCFNIMIQGRIWYVIGRFLHLKNIIELAWGRCRSHFDVSFKEHSPYHKKQYEDLSVGTYRRMPAIMHIPQYPHKNNTHQSVHIHSAKKMAPAIIKKHFLPLWHQKVASCKSAGFVWSSKIFWKVTIFSSPFRQIGVKVGGCLWVKKI